jgi:glyceraldehyde 3-phosphate dehydrogenase
MKIAINGFGRIGRTVLRVLLSKNYDRDSCPIRVLAINAPGKTPEFVCYSIKFDSVFGRLDPSIEVHAADDAIIICGQRIELLNNRDPEQLDWKGAGVEYVIESTGAFTTTKAAQLHCGSLIGAKKVIITAPASDETPM